MQQEVQSVSEDESTSLSSLPAEQLAHLKTHQLVAEIERLRAEERQLAAIQASGALLRHSTLFGFRAARVWAGPALSDAIVQFWNQLEAYLEGNRQHFPQTALRDLVAAIANRFVFRVGFVLLVASLISLGPLFLLYQQNQLIDSQNRLLEAQNRSSRIQATAAQLQLSPQIQAGLDKVIGLSRTIEKAHGAMLDATTLSSSKPGDDDTPFSATRYEVAICLGGDPCLDEPYSDVLEEMMLGLKPAERKTNTRVYEAIESIASYVSANRETIATAIEEDARQRTESQAFDDYLAVLTELMHEVADSCHFDPAKWEQLRSLMHRTRRLAAGAGFLMFHRNHRFKEGKLEYTQTEGYAGIRDFVVNENPTLRDLQAEIVQAFSARDSLVGEIIAQCKTHTDQQRTLLQLIQVDASQ